MKVVVGAGRLLCAPEIVDGMKAGVWRAPEALDSLKSNKAQVIQVGEDVDGFAKGDVVYYSKYAAVSVDVEDDTYMVIAAEEVMLKIEGL